MTNHPHPPSDSQAAPGDLERVRQLVNTLDLEAGQDGLASPEETTDWLKENRLLTAADKPLSRSEWERVVGVREALRSLLRANGGAEPEPRALELLDDASKRGPLTVRFAHHDGIELVRQRERARRRPGADFRDSAHGDDRREPTAAQDLWQRCLPVGLLRPLKEPLRGVVHDGHVRKPDEGKGLPGAEREGLEGTSKTRWCYCTRARSSSGNRCGSASQSPLKSVTAETSVLGWCRRELAKPWVLPL